MNGLEIWLILVLSYDLTLIGQVSSKGFEIIQIVKCLNCGKQGDFKRNCKQNQANSKRQSETSGIRKRCSKSWHWTKESRSTRDRATHCRETPRGPLTGPTIKFKSALSGQQQKNPSTEQLSNSSEDTH